MYVKVCGLKSAEMVAVAIEAGADARHEKLLPLLAAHVWIPCWLSRPPR